MKIKVSELAFIELDVINEMYSCSGECFFRKGEGGLKGACLKVKVNELAFSDIKVVSEMTPVGQDGQ